MDPNGQSYSNDAARAAADGKQNKQIRGAATAVAVVALGLLVQGCGGGGPIMACDDSKVQATVVGGANQNYRLMNATFMMTGLSDISTVSHTDQLNSCAATANYTSGAPRPITYTISADGEIRTTG